MMADGGNRSISHPSAFKGAQRWEAGTTTGRWQDKRPRGAATIGCGFSIGYEAISRGAGFPCTSRLRRFSCDFLRLARCVGHRP